MNSPASDSLAEPMLLSFASHSLRNAEQSTVAPSTLDRALNGLKKNPFPFLLISAALIATHLLLIVFPPKAASAFIFVDYAIATGMGTIFLVMHARSTSGLLSLRWTLFAVAAFSDCLYYAVSSYEDFADADFTVFDTCTVVLSSSLYMLGFTMPSEEQRKDERVLDFSIAVVYCAIRFTFMHFVVPGLQHHREISTVSASVRMILAILAWKAFSGSSADRRFFRAAIFAMVASFISLAVGNEISAKFFPNLSHNPLFLINTVEFVSVALFYYCLYIKEDADDEVKPYRPALASILPFTITAVTVFYSALLVTTHPYAGYAGITFGIAAFLARVALVSRHRLPEIVLEESLVREIASEIAKDPLYGLADRYGLEPALACARSSVNALSPLSLILFAVEERIGPLEELSEETESRGLVQVARALNNWHISDSTTCYLGSGRFAMLLPATPLRIAMSLAEQMCLSVDKLDITGEEGPMTIMAGVAACSDPSRVSNLLYTSSAALERAHVHREGRVRGTPTRGEARFDA